MKQVKNILSIIMAVVMLSSLTIFAGAYNGDKVIDLGNGVQMIVHTTKQASTRSINVESQSFTNIRVPVKPSKTLIAKNLDIGNQTRIKIEFDEATPSSNTIYLAIYDDSLGKYILCYDGDFIKPYKGSTTGLSIHGLETNHEYSIYIAAASGFTTSGRVFSE